MKFDLTKQIKLDGDGLRLYPWLQKAVYLGGLGLFVALIFMIIFPSFKFSFDFSTPNSKKNSIINVRKETGKFIKQGKVSAGEDNFFEASSTASFSNVEVKLTPNKKGEDFSSGEVEVRKGFLAFFSPEGMPRGFQDGSLLSVNNEYFIISDKHYRKFEDVSVLRSLGFSEEMFQGISENELNFNFEGAVIRSRDIHPNATVFLIDEEYYYFNGGKLDEFLSERAYLSHFPKEQAISKEKDFFEEYELSDNIIGFANGSLFAYGESAYVVDGENILPIISANIFQEFGFNWDDLIMVNGDEFSYYQKGDLFEVDSSHVGGTIFYEQEDGQWYIFDNQKIHRLVSENAAHSWSKIDPIIASKKSFSEFEKCQLEKKGFIFKNYFCEMPIEKLQDIPGKNYQFKFNFDSETNLDKMQLVFTKDINMKNLKSAIIDFLKKIKLTYVKE